MNDGFPLIATRSAGETSVALTPAKINLFLEVERRRADGYHDVTTLLLAVDFRDRLVVRAAAGGEDVLRIDGPAGSTVSAEENLVFDALRLLRERVPVPAVEVGLTKRIPPGAGLGGGSGNAAGMLVLADRHFRLGVPPAELIDIAARLGADVPFFLGPSAAAVGRGRGDRLTPLPDALGGDRPWFLLILPRLHSATAEAYRRVTFPLTSPSGPISFHKTTFVSSGKWIHSLFNRLEASVFTQFDELQHLVDWLERNASKRWRMTGSGSAFFVVCSQAGEARHLATELRAAFPQTLSQPGAEAPPAQAFPEQALSPTCTQRTNVGENHRGCLETRVVGGLLP